MLTFWGDLIVDAFLGVLLLVRAIPLLVRHLLGTRRPPGTRMASLRCAKAARGLEQ